MHEPRCYWVPWRVRFGHSRANSFAERRTIIQGLNFYSHVWIILTIVRRRVGAAHLIVMRTAASFTSRKGLRKRMTK